MTDDKPKLLTPRDILSFWLGQDESRYWKTDPDFDEEIRSGYGKVLDAAKTGKMDNWCGDRDGTLALTIVLDQFSRNIHRGTPQAFEADEQARAVANYAMVSDLIYDFDISERRWFVMPFMHSEQLKDQKFCVAMCNRYELDATLPHAMEHLEIIKQFGRFPHRNTILGREMTQDEQAFLDGGGFKG